MHLSRRVVLPVVVILLTGVIVSSANVRKVEASGPIYIRADGSVDPPTANVTTVDNVTYVFTDNIHDYVVVEKNSIVVDGAGYTVTGSGSGKGTDLAGRNNVTVRNMTIKKTSNVAFISSLLLTALCLATTSQTTGMAFCLALLLIMFFTTTIS